MIRERMIRRILFILAVLPARGLSFDLYEAESMALSSSMAIRGMKEEFDLASVNRKLGIRAFLPQLKIRYTDSYSRVLYGEDSESLGLVLDISQRVFDGGRAAAGRELSALQLELLSAAMDKAVETLSDRVRQVFCELLLYREKLKLQKELYRISLDQVRITRRRMELGSITEIDYLDALMNLREQEIGILETGSGKKTLEKDFMFLLGLDTRLLEAEELVLRGSVDRDYPGLPLGERERGFYEARALSCNLDLKKQESEILQARTRRRLVMDSYIPVIGVELSVSFSGDQLPLHQPGYSAGVVIDFPYEILPSSGRATGASRDRFTDTSTLSLETAILPDISFTGDRRTADLALKRELASLDEMRKQIIHQTSSLLETLEQRRLRLDLMREKQELLKRKLEVLEARNKLGEVLELVLLEARSEYYEGEIGLREAVLDLLTGERELEKLLGLGTGELSSLAEGVPGE